MTAQRSLRKSVHSLKTVCGKNPSNDTASEFGSRNFEISKESRSEKSRIAVAEQPASAFRHSDDTNQQSKQKIKLTEDSVHGLKRRRFAITAAAFSPPPQSRAHL
jgi:hypothetical protein